MARHYRLTYSITAGPPKAPDDLTAEEGLTDHLFWVSVLGNPGHPESDLSFRYFQLGQDGEPELPSPVVMYTVALGLLRNLAESHPQLLRPELTAAAKLAASALLVPFHHPPCGDPNCVMHHGGPHA